MKRYDQSKSLLSHDVKNQSICIVINWIVSMCCEMGCQLISVKSNCDDSKEYF